MAHNGKLVQVNVSDPRTPTNYPFINLLKGGREWTVSGGGPIDRTSLDVNGYPTSLPGVYAQTHLLGPTQAERPGNWVIKWDGVMTCNADGFTLISGSFSGTNGRAVIFKTPGGGMDFFITALGSPPATNIRICHIDDEALLDSGEIFAPHWLTYMAQFGLIRDLGWSDSSFSNLCRWVDRKPVGYWSYYEHMFPATKLAGTAAYTGTSDDDYTLTFGGFTNTDRNYAIVKFPVAQPTYSVTNVVRGASTVITIGTHILQIGQKVIIKLVGGTTGLNTEVRHAITAIAATTITISTDSSAMSAYTSGGLVTQVMYLDINGLGAKEILQRTGRPRGVDINVNEFLRANTPSHVSYDALLDGYLVWNNTDASGAIGVHQRVPFEITIALFNKLNSHGWFTGYYQALDPPSDFSTNLATLVQSTLNPGLQAYYEPPNETWNFQYLGTNNGFLRETARYPALNPIQAFCEWIGRTCSHLGKSVHDVYGGDTSKYNVVCAFQAFGGIDSQTLRRLNSPNYVSEGGTPASDWVTHVCFANYWNAAYYDTATETSLAATYAGGGAPADAALLQYVQSSTAAGTFSLPTLLTHGQDFYNLAVTYNKRLCFYEGGYSPDFINGAQVIALQTASRTHPLMETYELQNMNSMVGLGVRAEYPSFLGVGGAVAPWGLVDDLFEDPTTDPRWRAVLVFNRPKFGRLG